MPISTILFLRNCSNQIFLIVLIKFEIDMVTFLKTKKGKTANVIFYLLM